MTPYLESIPKWYELLKEENVRSIIYDADAIMDIVKYGAEEIFSRINSLKIENRINYLVLFEMMNTNNANEQLQILNAINSNKFVYNESHDFIYYGYARGIQQALFPYHHTIGCTPSPTDLMLSADLLLSPKTTMLLTGNIRDFPQSFFPRKSAIPLQKENQVKLLHLLTIDGNKIKEETKRMKLSDLT